LEVTLQSLGNGMTPLEIDSPRGALQWRRVGSPASALNADLGSQHMTLPKNT
jgi:hypothetical protein